MTLPYDEFRAAYQHVVDSREKAVKEIIRLERERDERAAQLEEAQAEAGALRQALMDIRKAAHFAHVTVYTEGKWDALCEEIKRRVDEVTPNGTAGAEFLSQYHYAVDVIKDLESKMLPVNEYVARLEEVIGMFLNWYDAVTPETDDERTEWVGMCEFEALLQDDDDLYVPADDPELAAIAEQMRAALPKGA